MRMHAFVILLMVLGLSSMALASAEAGEKEPGLFDGGPYDAIWTVLAFLLLVVVLWKMAWKPMLAGLSARQEYIERQIKDAEETSQKAKETLADYESKLSGVAEDGKRIIASHVKQAEKDAKEILLAAKEDAEAMKLKLEMDIERARQNAQEELVGEAGNLVLMLGEEVLGRAMNDKDHQKLVSEAIDKLKRQKESGSQQE